MTHDVYKAIRRPAAALLSAILLLCQLVSPVAALATDVTQLPSVTLSYQLAADGEYLSMPVVPTPSTQYGYVYWAKLDAAALGQPVTAAVWSPLDVGDGSISYAPSSDMPLNTMSTAVDYSVPTATIEVYQNGMLYQSYPLFLSIIDAPVEEVTPTNGFVTVSYVDADSFGVVASSQKEFAPGSYTITADACPQGYDLVDGTPVDVTISMDGFADISEVTFTVRVQSQETDPPAPEETDPPITEETDPPTTEETDPPAPMSGTIYIAYLDADNNVIYSESSTQNAGEYTITPSLDGKAELAGYQLTSTDPITVVVGADGSVSPQQATFFVALASTQPEAIGRYGITNTVVNFRREADKNSAKAFENVNSNNYVMVNSVQTVNGKEWYAITYNGVDCFVMAEYVNVLSQEDSDKYENANKPPVDVTVSYVDNATQQAFYTTTVSCPVNNTTKISVDAQQSAGYTLADGQESDVYVVVDTNSVADPAAVTFYFTKDPITASVTFNYYKDGKKYDSETRTLYVGDNAVAPDPARVQEGYVLDPDSVSSVNVSDQGVATPDTVDFRFTKPKVTAQVTFHYVGSDGATLYEDRVELLGEGTTPTEAYKYDDPSNYRYYNTDAAQVVVDADGAHPDEVTFTYEKIPVTASVTFHYVATDGTPLANDRTELLGESVYDTASFAITVPEGYELSSVSAQSFTIDANGANPSEITFTYAPVVVQPTTGRITVDYVDANGNTLQASQTFENLSVGNHDWTEFAIVTPEGYEAPTVSANTVTIAADGTATPAQLVFQYAPTVNVTTVSANVTFRFLNSADSTSLLPDATEPLELEVGANPVADFAAQINGFELVSTSPEAINVSAEGAVDVSEVVFTYSAIQTTAKVEIHYTNSIGEDFANSPQIKEYGPGTHSVVPDASYIPSGYALSNENPASYTITVDASLVVSPDEPILFACYDTSVTASVTVHYLDSSTMKDIAKQEIFLAPGPHVVEPAAGVVPNGYELSDASPSSYTVNVTETGVPSQSSVMFYYQPVTVSYYMGYAVTTQQIALRNQPNTNDSTIVEMLGSGTLLYLNGQTTVGTTVWSGAQTVLGTVLNNGVVQDAATRHITKAEADAIIAQYEKDHPKEEQPEQSSGYYITIGNNVPMRVIADQYASASFLGIDTVVYVMGQEYKSGIGWHISSYNGSVGYIRTTQLRKMETAEVEAYLKNQQSTPPASQSPAPYDPYAKSSYGYVTSSTVNFRETPGGSKIKTLNKYAFSLVLGTKEVNGVTWYNVNQSGTIGWIHGSYFHQLNLTELSSFLNSTEYKQGILNNSNTGNNTNNTTNSNNNSSSSGNNSTGSATAGSPISVEDWNVGTWQNTGVTAQTSYAPFNPYATASVTASVSPSASVEPTATFVIGTMIPITYDDESKETQTNSVPWGLIGAGIVLVGGAGGVYAYALNQNKKRKAAAARAAASRRANGAAAAAGATSAKSKQTSTSPYARRAVAAPPIAGSRQSTDEMQTPPVSGMSNPYSRGSITGTQSYDASDAYRPPVMDEPYKPAATEAPEADASPYVSPYNAGASGGLHSAGSLNRQAPAWTDESDSAPATPVTPIAPTEPIAPSAGSNPYARPLGNAGAFSGTSSTASDASSSASPRRATRMQRYHAAEDDDTNNE